MSAESARARLRELGDFAAPWSVWIAATLRLPDHIGSGASRLDELAVAAGADPGALRRLLAFLVAKGVFAEADGVYANTELSLLLRDEAGWRQWLDLDAVPGLWAESWAQLLPAVRSGSPGREEAWYYDELERRGQSDSFDALMEVQVAANAARLATVYDWKQVERVVDVGGGTGVLLRAVLAANPHLHGVLFDLPQVVAKAPRSERLEAVAGDLMTDTLPGADVYVLSQVLHGWPDRGAETVLARCAQAGGAGVRVLVVEGVLGETPTAEEASFDLFMLTLVGGRQRSLGDFSRLAEAVGLSLRSSQRLEAGSSLLELAG